MEESKIFKLKFCWRENNFVILLDSTTNILESVVIQLQAPKSYITCPPFPYSQEHNSLLSNVMYYLLLSTECLQLQIQPTSNRKEKKGEGVGGCNRGKTLNHLVKKR